MGRFSSWLIEGVGLADADADAVAWMGQPERSARTNGLGLADADADADADAGTRMGQPEWTTSLEVGALVFALVNSGLALSRNPSLSCISHASFKKA